MPRRLLCLGALLLATILAGCLPRTYRSWNFLVYMNGDNNLEYFAVEDFEEMERIGSTKHVNIFVLFDRSPRSAFPYDSSHEDWSDTRLYRVLRDNNPLKFNSQRLTPEWLTGHAELDMSDPATLRQFIVFCQKYYPAEHTVLTLWDHGSAVWPRAVRRTDGETPSAVKAVCWDDTTTDTPYPWNCLTTDEIARALADAKSVTGQKVDIINMDACLMQMLEVAYELWNGGDPLADYVVGSQADVYGDGNDYRAVLARLTANPAVTAREFAARLVDDYYAYYVHKGLSTTYSVLSLGGEFDPLVAAFKDFATALSEADENTMAEIKSIWDVATSFTGFNYSTEEAIDLYDFAHRLQSCQDEDVAAAALGLMNAFGGAMIHHRETGWYVNRAHGLSILLPDYRIWSNHYDDPDQYDGLALAADTDWDEFILRFVDHTGP